MKRDIDLARQLLLDIENRGVDCSVSVLRSEAKKDATERIRHHLQLLLDANLLKEVDRTSEGVPCVRLTHDGHELLELTRNESRWREAKWTCQDRIGCLSLAAIRGILLRWAFGDSQHLPRPLRVVPSRRMRYEPEAIRQRSSWEYDDVRYLRVRAEDDAFRDQPARNGVDLDGDGIADLEYESSLPTYLI